MPLSVEQSVKHRPSTGQAQAKHRLSEQGERAGRSSTSRAQVKHRSSTGRAQVEHRSHSLRKARGRKQHAADTAPFLHKSVSPLTGSYNGHFFFAMAMTDDISLFVLQKITR